MNDILNRSTARAPSILIVESSSNPAWTAAYAVYAEHYWIVPIPHVHEDVLRLRVQSIVV